MTRGSSVVERRAHNAKAAGSIPAPASTRRLDGCEGESPMDAAMTALVI